MRTLAIFALCCSSWLTPAWCQKPLSAIGPAIRVIDPSGAPIPHAKVKITVVPKQVESNTDGKAWLDLEPGTYELEVSEQGFKTYRDKVLVTDRGETINVALKIGSGGGPTVVVNTFDTDEEKAVWKLENDYWLYVRDLELEKYKGLWHANFIGWPFVSSAPVRKSSITDWIAQYQAKGLRLKDFDLRPADSVVKGNLVLTYYWITARWVDREGKGNPQTTRITHTWINEGGKWQILGGMSAVAESDSR